MSYQLQSNGQGVIDLATGACIPADPRNRDWQAYQEALRSGLVPLPATVLPADPPARDLAELALAVDGLLGKVATIEADLEVVKEGGPKPAP